MITATENSEFESLEVFSDLDGELIIPLTYEGEEMNLCLDKNSAIELVNLIKSEIPNLK